MRLVTNAIPLLPPLTGVGKYTYHVVHGLLSQRPHYDYTYYYGFFTRKLNFPRKKLVRLREFVKKIPVVSTWARLLMHQMGNFQLRNYDLYFEPNFIPQKIRAKRMVTTVHDFSFYLYPEWHPEERIQYFSKNFFRQIERADVIITMSDFVAGEAREIIKSCNSKIVSIPEGYDKNIFNPNGNAEVGTGTRGNYILYVGSIEPRKNLVNLLKAYLLLPGHMRREFKLVLAGFKGWHNAEIEVMLEKLRGSVEYLGYISDEELANLYRNASCFVYPSFYEGFGLPPLEAMACGCPVVVSDRASLPEVCGDGALYVDPNGPDSIAEGIHKTLTDTSLRERLVQKGFERANLFSWEKTVEEHIKVFEELNGSNGKL